MWWDHEEERSYFSPTSQVLVDSQKNDVHVEGFVVLHNMA